MRAVLFIVVYVWYEVMRLNQSRCALTSCVHVFIASRLLKKADYAYWPQTMASDVYAMEIENFKVFKMARRQLETRAQSCFLVSRWVTAIFVFLTFCDYSAWLWSFVFASCLNDLRSHAKTVLVECHQDHQRQCSTCQRKPKILLRSFPQR